MTSSEELEAFFDRAKTLNSSLGKLKGGEVKSSTLIEQTANLARDWMGFSQFLHERNIIDYSVLTKYDGHMNEVHNATKLRTRASSYQKKLNPFVHAFNDEIVIPLIRHEGSPEQVTARQLVSTFGTHLNSDELSYIEEAARCASVRSYRATLVLLWAAAVARMHRAVENIGFATYNTAVDTTINKKGSPFNKVSKAQISSLPELQRTRDYDLLVVGMELWKYDLQAFQELERLLGIRNNAAHPGMYEPTSLDLQQFALKLDEFVFKVIPN